MFKVYAVLFVHIILVLFFFVMDEIVFYIIGAFFFLEGIVAFYLGMKDVKKRRGS